MADAHLTNGPTSFPKKVGLYDPANEKDACGIGFIADLTRNPTRSTVVVRALLLQLRSWGLPRPGAVVLGDAAPVPTRSPAVLMTPPTMKQLSRRGGLSLGKNSWSWLS